MTQAPAPWETPAPTGPPAPPPGPGVVPPYPAPPVEGRGARVGMGLGVGALILFLICGGGVAAVIGLGTVMGRALNEQAEVVVGQYLRDLEAEQYGKAYDSLCAEAKQTESLAQFTRRMSDEPIDTHRIGQANLADVNLSVPVTVTYSDGETDDLRAYLGQNSQTGQFQVCSLR